DGLDGHREGQPVEVADGDGGADEHGDPPAQPGAALRARGGGRLRAHHSSTSRDRAWRGSATDTVAWPPSRRTVGWPARDASWPAASSSAYCFSSGAIGEPMRFQAAYELLWVSSMR